MIRIDGSAGEGGGQMLRSALSLSLATGKAFRMENIRAKRERGGLLRQQLHGHGLHLAARCLTPTCMT